MQLQLSTWPEVESYLQRSTGIIIPTGSTEQHGPIGLIGTDALCAEHVALQAAQRAEALVAPPLAYAPAQFNMAFPGTVSIPSRLFAELCLAIFKSLAEHGFRHLYVLNGHGANLAPLQSAMHDLYGDLGETAPQVRIRSWWDYGSVNALRQDLYGDWEGMHATPSEVAITQAAHRVVEDALEKPDRLSADYVRDHAGDKHGPAEEHRQRFPDGRVGSDSGLASPEDGQHLIDAAARAAAEDYRVFLSGTGE